jgi:tRNA A37 methylthiotransferase MiaB
VVDVSFPEIEKFDHLPAPRAEGSSAFVSIMEGCSKYCTFCVVPYTRGDEVSRGFDSVLDEVKSLAAQGVGEITLLGQNVNAYAGPMADGTVVDLATLIHYVAGSMASNAFASPLLTRWNSATRSSRRTAMSPSSPTSSIWRCSPARTASWRR